MLTTQVLERLSALNRQALPATPVALIQPPTAVAIGDEGARGEEVETAWGPCWRIERRLAELWPRATDRLPPLECALTALYAQTPAALHSEMQSLASEYPRRVLFLDLETCGLAGAMAFLVGLLHHDGDSWRLTQFLARDYSEEKAMLQSLWSIAGEKTVLATFNGKSFDWPLVHDRSTLHHLGRRRTDRDEPADRSKDALARIDPRPELSHCDLLHHARRRWRAQLPNCKLQTLEQHLCRRRRTGDIAGRDIPAAYHEFVRGKDPRQMDAILHHNALDLATLLEVSLRVGL